MKKIFTFLLIGGLFTSAVTFAQSFTVQHDTVSFFTAGSYTAEDAINNTSGFGQTIQWKVVSCNFPADWVTVAGICDNANCYTGSGIWPSGTMHQSLYPSGLGTFHMTIDLSSVTTTGTYYMRVKLNTSGSTTDTAMETFIVTKVPAAVTPVKSESDVSIYPNPATNQLNVIYDANAEIKTISVISMIGKVMNVYKVTDNSGANLNIDNLPAGIYFVRLMNTRGDVVATRRFTKQ